MHVSIRNADTKDIYFITECILAAVDSYDFTEPTEEFASILKVCAMPDTLYSYKNARIAEVDGVAAGCLTSYPGDNYAQTRQHTFEEIEKIKGSIPILDSDHETGPGEYYLDAMAIRPEFRGHSIGLILLKDGIARAKENGKKTVTLLVNSNHERLAAYYASLGFEGRETLKYFGKLYTKMYLEI